MRRAPDVLSRGVPEELRITAAAGSSRGLRGRQASPPDVDVEPAEGELPLSARIVARRRGRQLLPPVATRSVGPLGLAAWYRQAAGRHEARVYPDLPAARRIALAVRRSSFREQGVRGRGQLGLGTEFELVRDYSPDDDVRQVNWLATARMGRPMSNEYRLEQDREVVAVIDSGRLMGAPVESGTMLDAAIDALTAIAVVADELGDRFGALAFDAEIRRQLRPRRGGGARAVNALFDLEPTTLDSDYVRAFQQVEGSKRAFVVVFTDLLDEAAARSLIDGVPVLARRHAVTVASIADSELDRAVATPPADELDAHRAAVALDVLDARRRVTAKLVRAGAGVVEAPPGKLGPACVRAYLKAKARARL